MTRYALATHLEIFRLPFGNLAYRSVTRAFSD